jgi:molybdopterin molybdotransferase
MEQGFFEVVSRERFEELLRGFPLLETETVPLERCHGRILAQDLAAPEDLPALARSCMDGFAVRARDVFGASGGGPAYLELAGEIAVDRAPDFALSPGTCARIPTGGALPEGADAVVMVEQTHEMSGTVEVRKSLAPGDNVMLQGEDVLAGGLALEAGRLLRVPEVGLLAALGLLEAPVRRRARVDVLSTGNEVVPVSARPKPGQVRDVNSLALACLAQEAGAEARTRGILPDRLETLRTALLESLDASDCVLLSGGSSVGVRDLTVAALETLPEAAVLAHGVALSPGKPTILARVGGKPVIGLPGQVASAQVVMLVLVQPFLRHLMGDARAFDRSRRVLRPAELARNLASKPGREDYVRVRLEEREGRPPLAHPLPGKSGLLKTLLQAQGLVAVPADREGLYAGAAVDVWLL